MSNKSLKFTSYFENIQDINDSFATANLRVAFHGMNRNSSNIYKSAFESAVPSMYNIPIVVNYLEDVKDEDGNQGDFGGHDVELKKVDGQYKIVNKTSPIGVVPESATWFWKEHETPEEGLREYFTTQVILWKRQEAYEKVKELKTVNHSMEIHVNDANFNNETGYYDIKDFTFEAFCLLGTNVEPCFSGSQLELNFNKDDFKTEYQEMINEFKQFKLSLNDINNTPKGGMTVDEKQELLKKYNLTVEQLNFNIDELTVEELDGKLKEFSEQLFTLSAEQFRQELINTLRVETIKDKWDWEYSRYSFVDNDETIVYALDAKDNWNLYGLSYIKNGDTVIIDFESAKRYKINFLPFEDGQSLNQFSLFTQEVLDYSIKAKENEINANFAKEQEDKDVDDMMDSMMDEMMDEMKHSMTEDMSSMMDDIKDKMKEQMKTKIKKKMKEKMMNSASEEFQLEVNNLKENYSLLENEISTLKENNKNLSEQLSTYQVNEIKAKKEEVYSLFSEAFSEDELKTIKEETNEISLENLENELYKYVGKKKYKFSRTEKKDKAVVKITPQDDNADDNPYPALTHIYNKIK